MNATAIAACFAGDGERRQRRLIAEQRHDPTFIAHCWALCDPAVKVSVRRWAHEVCAQTRGPAYAARSRLGLGDAAMSVRLHTLIGIGAGPVPSRLDWLLPLLADPAGSIRLNALTILLARRPQAVRRHLPRLQRDPKAYVRRLATAASV